MTTDFFADVKAAKEQLADVADRDLDRAIKNLPWHLRGDAAETARAELALEAGWKPQLGDWPIGIIARYATVGGATVDITMAIYPEIRDEPARQYFPAARVVNINYTARCQGCNDHKDQLFENVDVPRVQKHHEDFPGYSWDGVRPWAQTHAEKCRALPRPQAGA